MVEILKTFLFLPVLNQLEANRDKVRVHRRPGGGGGGDKLVFKGSGEPQKSTISLLSYFYLFLFIIIIFVFLSGCIFGPEAV